MDLKKGKMCDLPDLQLLPYGIKMNSEVPRVCPKKEGRTSLIIHDLSSLLK